MIGLSPDAETWVRSVALGTDTISQVVHIGAAFNPPDVGKGEFVPFKKLEELAATEAKSRNKWKGRIIEVQGPIFPVPRQRSSLHARALEDIVLRQ